MTTNIEQIQAAQIERLTCRVRELECGLDELWSTISVEKHPLLRDDGMVVSGPSTPPVGISTPSPIHHDSSVHRDNIINYLGTRCRPSSYIVRYESSEPSRHTEYRPKRRFVLLWRDGERRGTSRLS